MTHLSLLLSLAQSQSESVLSIPLLVAIPSSMILSGIILLVGFYFVHRRFLTVEFPGYVERVDQRLDSLVHSTEKMEEALVKLTVLIEKHELKFDHTDWRLRQLERQHGPTPGEKG